MFENRISHPSHENNGQSNGVLHEMLPGSATLPPQAEPDRNVCPVRDATQSVAAARCHGDRGNEVEPATDTPPHDPSSRAASAAGADRGPDGRFLTGNRGGPGNPFGRRVGLIRTTLFSVCTPEDMAEILAGFVLLAKRGDLESAKFVFNYMVGKPTPATNPDRLDFEEFQGYRDSANWMAEVPALLTRPSRWMPLGILREGQPAITKERGDQLAYVLNAKGKEREKVERWLCDPDKGLEKIDNARHRHQTASRKKQKQRRR